MAKKPSGLGRGLGDLLEDNSPEITTRGKVVIRGGEEKTSASTPSTPPAGYVTKPLYTEKPKRSIKANFKK